MKTSSLISFNWSVSISKYNNRTIVKMSASSTPGTKVRNFPSTEKWVTREEYSTVSLSFFPLDVYLNCALLTLPIKLVVEGSRHPRDFLRGISNWINFQSSRKVGCKKEVPRCFRETSFCTWWRFLHLPEAFTPDEHDSAGQGYRVHSCARWNL